MSARGYRIFINTAFEGPVPAVRERSADDPAGSPGRVCVFATAREARVEMVEKVPSTSYHPRSTIFHLLSPWRIDFRMTIVDFGFLKWAWLERLTAPSSSNQKSTILNRQSSIHGGVLAVDFPADAERCSVWFHDF